MADTENHTLRLLQEIRQAITSFEARTDVKFAAVDERFNEVERRLDNLRHLATGESVLGRYAAAEVEERLG